MKKLLILACLLPLTACFDYSDGDRTGTVTKLSRSGMFCKTWEGQMLMGGLKKVTNLSSDGKSSVDTMAANTFEFTVEDDHLDLIPKIQAAMDSGQRITLTYRKELISFCRSDSDSYFITAVK